MSYSKFKSDIISGLGSAHTNKTKAAKVISKAYTDLILRHVEILSGGGKFTGASGKTSILKSGIQTEFSKNLASGTEAINTFQQWDKYIYQYWTGLVCTGSTGVVVISSTGTWLSPTIPPNDNSNLWLSVLIGTISTHILTLVGTYTNNVTGITTPWSGALLQTTP